jgi:hypothetical protein
MSEGVGLGFAAMSLIGSAFAAAWVASALYLGRAFQRREQGDEPGETQPAAAREAVAGHRP